jgi:O-antigen/teichoic acid export membrane protein
LIDILNTSTSNVMMINMRHRVLNDDHAAALSIWLDSVRKMSFVLFPLVTLLLLVAPVLIVLLFGENYAESVPVFMVWTASTTMVCLLTDGVLRVFAQNRYLIFQNMVRLIIVMLLIRYFIDRFQLIGAVLVTTTAGLVIKIIALHRVTTLLKTPWSNILPWRSQGMTALVCGLSALPCLGLLKIVVLPQFATLVLISALYPLTYILLLFTIGPLTREEKRLMLVWAATPLM